ncbi:conserved hypothetical protein [Ricinus communis]|uniref:Uncharacterized protein n=1 Tax=Ricinus communis TaxID=3988 RepID=B9RGU2_RICCO|nr:conserved hypothetical protein [Ricinus communis]|eukprot:XP_002512801.1 uncharacterized protein LOC8273066 [Ricinus communis]
MTSLTYQLFSSTSLISLGLYRLIFATRNYLKSPQSYIAKPYHPLPFSSSSRFKHLQLYLLILCLLISFTHQTIISSDSDPLLKGRTPVHRFTSLQSASLIFLFLILSLALLLSETTSLLPLPPDLFFALGSALLFLQYSVASSASAVQTSDIEAKCDTIFARISFVLGFLCLILAFKPRVFIADVGLGGAFCLLGLWALQTGLSLYVEGFIPEGCHRLLDVVNGIEGSTKCDLEESKLRAVAILDLMFVIHVMFVIVIVMVIYGVVAKSVGGVRRLGSYEALPTTTSTAADSNHIQMKALTGTQA